MSNRPVQFRPRRVRWIAVSCAAVLFTMFMVMAVFLRQSDTGVYFRVSDQVALGVVGLLLALGMLMLCRPLVRADAEGVSVRNVFFSERFGWQEILAVSFPDGASFARLELPHDEYYSVIAVQAMDHAHAVEAVRTLRRLHRDAVGTGEAEDTGDAEQDPGAPEALETTAEQDEPADTEQAAQATAGGDAGEPASNQG